MKALKTPYMDCKSRLAARISVSYGDSTFGSRIGRINVDLTELSADAPAQDNDWYKAPLLISHSDAMVSGITYSVLVQESDCSIQDPMIHLGLDTGKFGFLDSRKLDEKHKAIKTIQNATIRLFEKEGAAPTFGTFLERLFKKIKVETVFLEEESNGTRNYKLVENFSEVIDQKHQGLIDSFHQQTKAA